MCIEYIAIAQCAPTKVPCLSFTCGQLHLIAGRREVCEKAQGSCVCFFATCGTISQEASPAPLDWSTIQKVRCLPCTKREDHVGAPRANQELLDSPLLTRNAVLPSEQHSYAETIRGLWHGSEACPFHQGDDHPKLQHGLQTPTGDGQEKSLASLGESLQGAQASSPTGSSQSSATDPFKPKRGLAASRWATAPAYTPPNKFVPRPRRPIPIVRPASMSSSPGSKSPEADSTKACTTEKVDVNPPASVCTESLEGKWVPPHLRHRQGNMASNAVAIAAP